MSNSVVKVTETPSNDSLILVIDEDGTVTPDKETVEAYLNSRFGETKLQIMQINKSDGKNMDVTVETITYLANEDEEAESNKPSQVINNLERNLKNFRMDHDYTLLTVADIPSPEKDVIEVDELAQTLSILEGSNVTNEIPPTVPTQIKLHKPVVKPKKLLTLNTQTTNKFKIKTPQSASVIKQPTKDVVKVKADKQKQAEEDYQAENFSDEDFSLGSEESEDDQNDSDFELELIPKAKVTKKIIKGQRSRIHSDSTGDQVQKSVKTPKQYSKPVSTKVVKVEQPEPVKVEKLPEPVVENKVPEKKVVPKKEKKTPKPIPDDLALFSTPDIIRRVGGKQDSITTPTTPIAAPEFPKLQKPAKIFHGTQSKSSTECVSTETRDKRLSTEKKDALKYRPQRLSLGSEPKSKDRRLSMDVKMNRPSVDSKAHTPSKEKLSDTKKSQATDKCDGNIVVPGLNETIGRNSADTLVDGALGVIPSAEDIRAIIQNEDTKTFTSNLVIPEPLAPPTEQSHMSLENSTLDLDQSILDNINSDLISEDILYQVAQSLVGNTELQNAIDKSLVDENLVLDPSLSQSITSNHNSSVQEVNNSSSQGAPMESNTSSVKGTQVVRSGGRVVVIPPIERPTTRSRNKKKEEVSPKSTAKPYNKVVDEEHVYGAELDSSSDDEKSDDDPDKLWCICNQPHNNRFMICCDNCEEWYHGKCVNVTKAMGQMMEQQGKEWICLYCKDNSLKRPAAAARRIRKASRNSNTELNEKKSEPAPTPTVASPVQPPPAVPGCLVCGKPCRSNSIYCSDPCILKHAKVVEKVVVFERSSGTIYSGNNAPSAANLDKWLQQHPGFEVVRSTNANKPVTTKLTQSKLKLVKNSPDQGGVSLAVQQKGIVGVLRHSPKPQHHQQQQQQQQQPPQTQQQTSTPPKILNKQHISNLKVINKHQATPQPRIKLIQPVPIATKTLSNSSTSPKPKLVQTTLKCAGQSTPKEKPMPQKTPKTRQAEETLPSPNKQENIRDNVRKTLFDQLSNRLKLAEDIKLTKDELTKISSEIESQLYKCFGDTGQKYRNKYRSLIFNIKDTKNQTLWRRICEKSINPYQLVRLSPDDLASQELALWRERENKHQLDMITKSELEQLGRNRQYVFKTHKGEQVLENNRPTDAVENTEVITTLGSEENSSELVSTTKKDSKEREKKTSKHSRSNHDKHHNRNKSNKERGKSDRKDRKREHLSTSRDQDHHKRSKSKDLSKNLDKNYSRSRDKERHHRSHKSSKHKDIHSTTEKLDKKSKEILEQLVDNKIVPPLEDRLWKHVQQEDITTALNVESDSDHEPTSTVTIPTPPHPCDSEELDSKSIIPTIETEIKENRDTKTEEKISSKDISLGLFSIDEDGSKSPPPRNQANYIWKGTINMVDVAQISITAHEVSGDCGGLGEELPNCLDVVGRISPDTVWDYIRKMKCSNSKMISLVRLNANNIEEKMPYIALYSYLSSRNRLGVVKSNNKAVKDFYILPLASQTPIPQALLPLSGPGFEESRPSLLLGIIVRDKRKRPLFATSPILSKKAKLDVISIVSATSSVQSNRSYTPPPILDPRLKSVVPPKVTPTNVKEVEDDMDEPYSPEDSDPDTLPTTTEETSKPISFLDSSISTQAFEPFSSKFDTIPGLDEGSTLPANSQEIQRKMEELDQRIAMQKAEIHNMSQDIASSTTTGIGTSALASIALPSNLQQILDSIKGINPSTATEAELVEFAKAKNTGLGGNSSIDLTIPLILPKIGTRNFSGPTNATVSSATIPLNLPKHKGGKAPPPVNIPALFESKQNPVVKKPSSRIGESTSVLSTLTEEDLIRKAAEMLGESPTSSITLPTTTFPQTKFIPPPPLPLQNILPPPPIPQSSLTSKKAQLDINQPPIPGLDD